MSFNYTNPSAATFSLPISETNYMYIGCAAQAFDLTKDIRVIRALQTGTKYLGTTFLPGTKLNEVSVDVTPVEKCATWCLGKGTGEGAKPNCVTLAVDSTLSTDKTENRICQDSRVKAAVGEPTYKCDSANPPSIIADVQALIEGAANPSWSVTCTAGKSVAIDKSMGRTLRLSLLVSDAPASCDVQLTASIGGVEVVAPTKKILLSNEQTSGMACATQPPLDLCGVAGGKNACLDCKGIPFGPNVAVPECGCIDPKDKGAISTCYKCNQTDESKVQVAVDSSLKSMEKVIKQMLNAEAVLLGKEPSSFAQDIRQQVNKAQVSGWTVVWTKIESVVYNCPSPESVQSCTVIPPVEQQKALGTIRCHADNILYLGKQVAHDLIKKASTKGISSDKKSRALSIAKSRLSQLNKLYNVEIAALTQLPNTYVSCSRASASVTIQADLSCTPINVKSS